MCVSRRYWLASRRGVLVGGFEPVPNIPGSPSGDLRRYPNGGGELVAAAFAPQGRCAEWHDTTGDKGLEPD